jgi:hypothetical protein
VRSSSTAVRSWPGSCGARALLAPVYATFTEGFTTRDLIDAEALLDELA